ncbi:LysR family transcriptional regulator [Nesterenkonia populi]|uniref:LysR family transcriptional regulator n=1 Tax=Nesterenkonia populi TaxID=1591087 RepID=UPI0011BFCAD2|nr:LysR family transcriptional regulator [Nesterenkonia populi]
MGVRLIDEALPLLEAVAQYGGVNAAADVLGRNASGISRQIQRLSAELGTPLLERQGRTVELTAAAEALVRAAPQLHAADEAARMAVSDAADPSVGELRIASHVFAISSIVLPALHRWGTVWEHSVWRVREAEPALGQRLLTAREADIVIMPAGPHAPADDHPRFAVRRLVTEPADLIVPRGHPLAVREDEVKLAEASQEPWILGSAGQGSRQEILEQCSKAGFTPPEDHHAQDWTAVSTLVASGLGVSLMPRMAPTHPGVVRVSLSGPTAPVRTILTAVRRGSEQRRLISAALDILTTTAADAVASQQPLLGLG